MQDCNKQARRTPQRRLYNWAHLKQLAALTILALITEQAQNAAANRYYSPLDIPRGDEQRAQGKEDADRWKTASRALPGG